MSTRYDRHRPSYEHRLYIPTSFRFNRRPFEIGHSVERRVRRFAGDVHICVCAEEFIGRVPPSPATTDELTNRVQRGCATVALSGRERATGDGDDVEVCRPWDFNHPRRVKIRRAGRAPTPPVHNLLLGFSYDISSCIHIYANAYCRSKGKSLPRNYAGKRPENFDSSSSIPTKFARALTKNINSRFNGAKTEKSRARERVRQINCRVEETLGSYYISYIYIYINVYE